MKIAGSQARARQERPAETQLSAPGKQVVGRPRYMPFFQPRLRHFALWQAPGLIFLGDRVHAMHSARHSRLTTMARFVGREPRVVNITISKLVDAFGDPTGRAQFRAALAELKTPVDSEDRTVRSGTTKYLPLDE